MAVKHFMSVYNRSLSRHSGVMITVVGNGLGDTSSNPRRECISYSANTLGKGMNPTGLLPAMGK